MNMLRAEFRGKCIKILAKVITKDTIFSGLPELIQHLHFQTLKSGYTLSKLAYKENNKHLRVVPVK